MKIKRQNTSLFEPFRWWRIRRQLLTLTPKRTCTDCGFLAFGDVEADAEARTMLDTKGAFGGLPGPVEKWNCARNLWDWGLHYSEPNWDAVIGETCCDRRGCPGFVRHVWGRTPEEHFTLESDTAEFRRKLVLGLLPLVYGTLGVMIGWLLKR
jgi:hypothetical protein